MRPVARGREPKALKDNRGRGSSGRHPIKPPTALMTAKPVRRMALVKASPARRMALVKASPARRMALVKASPARRMEPAAAIRLPNRMLARRRANRRMRGGTAVNEPQRMRRETRTSLHKKTLARVIALQPRNRPIRPRRIRPSAE